MEPYTACMAYLEKLPHANSGSGGHNATLQAALACKRFGFSGSDMWNLMQWFNDHKCTPRWSDRELQHKIDSVSEVTVNKPLGQSRGFKRAKTFLAPAVPVKVSDTRPIAQRSAQDEELWWATVAQEREATLEQWDELR